MPFMEQFETKIIHLFGLNLKFLGNLCFVFIIFIFVSPAVQPSLTLDYLVRSFIDIHAATKGANCLLTLISWIISNESSSVSPGHVNYCLCNILLLVVLTICMSTLPHEDSGRNAVCQCLLLFKM